MLALPFHPLTTVLLLTLAITLITLEFNRPGLILPGSAGLLLLLFCIASILKTPGSWGSLIDFGFATIAFVLDTRKPRQIWTTSVLIFLYFGFKFLIGPHPSLFSHAISILCAALIAFGTHHLNEIARRARVNKGLD